MIPAVLLLANLILTQAGAHEFWLEPESYSPPPDKNFTICHNYGQYFKTDGLPFVTEWHPRYIVLDDGRERKVSGFDGDLPAIQIKVDTPGLKAFGYFGAIGPRTFDTLAKFQKYNHKLGYDQILEWHRALRKPDTGIVESYTRNAKLGVGDGAGADRALGLTFELVAERAPYNWAANATLPVQLLLRGKLAAGFKITTFSQTDPNIPITAVADVDGRAQISLPVRGAYLLNAIHKFQPAQGSKTHWESLWASLAFAVQ